MFLLIGFMWTFVAFVLTEIVECRFPPSTRFIYRHKIKDSSILNKLFNRNGDNPLDYFRAVPLWFSFFSAVFVSICAVLNLFFEGVCQWLFADLTVKVLTGTIFISYIAYYFVMHAWWSIERKKDSHGIASEEIYQLEEELRKLRKEEEKERKKQSRKQDKKK